MGLNDSYSNVQGQILLIEPLPSINKAFSLVVQEEGQRDIASFSSQSVENNVLFIRNQSAQVSQGNQNFGNKFTGKSFT